MSRFLLSRFALNEENKEVAFLRLMAKRFGVQIAYIYDQ